MGKPGKWLGGAVVLVVALVAGAWFVSAPSKPDAFYDIAIPTGSKPGTLIASQPFDVGVPPGVTALRVLYVTSRKDGTPATSSALIAYKAQATNAARPILAWAHGTTGVARGCAPSLIKAPFSNIPAFPALLDKGWIFVASDYQGLGTPGPHTYLDGEEAAISVIDAVRATALVPNFSTDGSYVVWGHSQGGNTALWTGIVAQRLAPELRLKGVAALAPASDLQALVKSAQGSMFGKIVSSYVIEAAHATGRVAKADYVQGTYGLISTDMAGRCVGEVGTLFSVAETVLLPKDGLFSNDPNQGALAEYLKAGMPSQAISVPLLIAQGKTDDLVLLQVQNDYVAARKAAGQTIDYRLYEGRDHIGLVAADSPLGVDLLDWTERLLQ